MKLFNIGFEMNSEEMKKNYQKVINLMEKSPELFPKHEVESLKVKAGNHSFYKNLAELGYDFGKHNIRDLSSDWHDFSFQGNLSIGYYAPGYRDVCNGDKDAPKGHYLHVGFSTGAYILNEVRADNTFNDLIKYLIAEYQPDYVNYLNRGLYFKIERGARIFNEMPSIIKEWRVKAAAEVKDEKIKALQSQLSSLQND